jgi:predicted phage terminase large subunit-like protein
LLRRRAARTGLIAFTEYTLPSYESAWHHALIGDALDRVAKGVIDRLMINMPPRHGKSELASRRFPAMLLGMQPEQTIISASYNVTKADEFGGEVRDIVRSAEYRALYPNISLKEDTQAKGFWRTDQGGYYIAAGVGTAITGRGTIGPIVLIDDPLKDRAEADSEVRRETVKSWYSSSILSRLPRAIIVIQTRWHEDDLSGWLLDQQEKGGDRWEVLTLPAINEEGGALWPEFYPIEKLERIKRSSIPRDWSALFQQSPAPDEGDFFHRDWFQRFKPDEKPARLSIFGTSDYAVSEGKGDYTVHRVWGIDEHGHIWLLAGWRGQTTSDVWIDRLLDLIHAHKPFAWFGESGVIQKSIEPYLLRRSQERRVYCRWEWLPSMTDKGARARGFQARAAMKMVHIPEGPDGDTWIEELIRFPAGKHDDEVDTASLIGRALDEAHPATSTAPVEKTKPNDYGFGRKQTSGDWMTS